MWLAEIFISWIVDHDILANAFIIVVCKGIKHVSEYSTQWILIKVSVSVALVIQWAIAEGAFLYCKPEVAAYNNIRWTNHQRTDLILYGSFYHTIVYITRCIRYFKFYHHRSGAYIAACKWNTWTVYRTTVSAVHRWYSTRNIIYAGSFCCPVKVNAAIHSSCAEGYRTTIVVATIIEDSGRY